MSSPVIKSQRLALPFIAPAQSQKHVTHNEAVQILDTLCHLTVQGIQTNPPDSPQNDMLFIVANDAIDGWSGKAGDIAHFLEGAWRYYTPRTGWTLWREDTSELTVYADGTWSALNTQTHHTSATDILGINTTATDENRLSVKSPNSLFDHEGQSHRLTINKSQETETAAVLFKSAYTGHAEIGLTGDNQFHIKVSIDGINWNDAMTIDGSNGQLNVATGLYVNGHRVHDDGNTPQALALQGTIDGVENLDSYSATGMWHQNANSLANNGTNYPAPWAGLLTVVEALPMVYQTYQTYETAPSDERNATFTRGRYNGVWSA